MGRIVFDGQRERAGVADVIDGFAEALPCKRVDDAVGGRIDEIVVAVVLTVKVIPWMAEGFVVAIGRESVVVVFPKTDAVVAAVDQRIFHAALRIAVAENQAARGVAFRREFWG